MKYWASWWSGNYEDEGCKAPPFKFWESGIRMRGDSSNRDDWSICAVIEGKDKEGVWKIVQRYFPDFKRRFCKQVEDNFHPGDRFP